MARILLIEDSPTDTAVLTQLLERHGHQVLASASAEENTSTKRLIWRHLRDIAGISRCCASVTPRSCQNGRSSDSRRCFSRLCSSAFVSAAADSSFFARI